MQDKLTTENGLLVGESGSLYETYKLCLNEADVPEVVPKADKAKYNGCKQIRQHATLQVRQHASKFALVRAFFEMHDDTV